MAIKNHKLAAIVFTDIVGYTKQMEKDEQRTMQLLQKQREIIFPLIESYGGELIKEIGDGLLIMFESAVDAVRFATAVQKRLKDEELTIRAGIHIGDIIFKDGDVFGSAVNTAARIEPLAQPNGICISEDVRKQLSNKDDIVTISCGRKELKGVSRPVEIFEVIIEGVTVPQKHNLKFFIKDLLNRRVIQIFSGYIAAAWIIKQAVAAIISKYMLSPHLVELTWVVLLSLIPSILLISYFHGKSSTSKWHKLELIGIPINAVLAVLLVVFMFRGKELGAATTKVTAENEKGEKIERTIIKNEFRKKMAIFIFDNESNDTAYNWLQFAISSMLEYDLSQDIYFQIKQSDRIISKLKDAGFNTGTNVPLMLKKQIANYYHLPYFLSGSFNVKDGKYIIHTKLYDSEKAKLISENTYSDDDLFQAIDKITVETKQDVDIPQTHIEEAKDLPIKEIYTKSVKALEYFSKGLYEIQFINDYKKAEEYMSKSVEIDPGFTVAQLALSQIYFNQSKMEKARISLRKVIDNIYSLPERQQVFAKYYSYIINEQADKAGAVVKMATELYPDDMMMHYILGARYQMDNKISEAVKEYKLCLKLDPDYYDLWVELGYIYEMSEKPDSALFCFKKYAKRFPKDFKSYKYLGYHYFTIAEFDKAREYYEKANLLETDNVNLAIKLANIDFRTGNFDKAISEYYRILDIAETPKDSADVYSAIETFYSYKGKFKKAYEFFDKYNKLREKFQPPIQVLANRAFSVETYFNAGEKDKLYSILKEIEKLDPPLDKISSFGYMVVAIQLKDTSEKVDGYITDAENLATGFGQKDLIAGVYLVKGQINELRGKYQEAIADYEKYFELQPTGYSSYRLVSRVYRKSGKYKKAEEYIKKALKHYPYSPSSNYEAALLYLDMNDTAKAIDHLKRANEIWKDADPDYEEAKEAKAKLNELEESI